MIVWAKKLTDVIARVEANADEAQLDQFIDATQYNMIESHGLLDTMLRAEEDGKPFTSKKDIFYLCGPIDDDPDNWRIVKAGPAEGGHQVSEEELIKLFKTAAKNLKIKV